MSENEVISYIDIQEFREAGYLQEANRRFFHPLGLALEIFVEEDGTERLDGIWDYRQDPEGVIFGDGVADVEKARRVDAEIESHRPAREALFGDIIQPLA